MDATTTTSTALPAPTSTGRLTIHADRHPDGAVAVRLSGELVVATAATARRAVVEVVEDRSAHSITIDLDDVSALDVAGLAAVTAPAVQCLRRPTSLTIVPPRRPGVSRLVDRVGVITIINRTRS